MHSAEDTGQRSRNNNAKQFRFGNRDKQIGSMCSAFKVIIVGAGVSGIAAACRLYEHGVRNIEILEATDRIGGRIHSVPFGTNFIDYGAQWCHGEKNNVIFEMANPLGILETSIVNSDIRLVTSDGIVDQDITDRLMALHEKILESEDRNKYVGTFGDYVTNKYMDAINQDDMKDIDRKLVGPFLNYLHDAQRGLDAIDSWFDRPAEDSDGLEPIEGDPSVSWKGKGSITAINLLLNRHPAQTGVNPIPIEDMIVFNKKVTSINWNSGPDEPVKVTCSDGTEYKADHVILTVSLGVLKEKYHEMFVPTLPIMKQNAIKGIFFGTVNKIMMEFETPFWNDFGNVFSLLWDPTDLEEIRASKHSWIVAAASIFKVDCQPNLLVIWLNGPKGRESELLPDAEIIEGIMVLLNKFLKFAAVEKPKQIMRSKWSTDPNFRGSYSSRSLATNLLRTGFRDLAVPLTDCLGKPVLLFAGEATNEKRYGTIQGATESGWREADRLINFHKR
ncbi:peroxisomal N(1)-acetyl-spermine/spermidine oxidase-like [Uranotaenia lowii]|uniref:peroxisomal N(1)-acetyl-spermine/spermidine oxidase-like n=1 Tax=Uranotaenia lowii TaxID=190385 RepID=UPI00247AAF33|nr:peroxisomal N(1)-acetyl-spermine/spermidine oxidase-like [Uranotaenia lowii]